MPNPQPAHGSEVPDPAGRREVSSHRQRSPRPAAHDPVLAAHVPAARLRAPPGERRCHRARGLDPAARVGWAAPKVLARPVVRRRCHPVPAVPGSRQAVLARVPVRPVVPVVSVRRTESSTSRLAPVADRATAEDPAAVADAAVRPVRSSPARAAVRPATAAGHRAPAVRNAPRGPAAHWSRLAAVRPEWLRMPAAADPEARVAAADRAGWAVAGWSGRSRRAAR
ncbi:hypothetical protein NONI108955_39985 [Nocardia ninae]